MLQNKPSRQPNELSNCSEKRRNLEINNDNKYRTNRVHFITTFVMTLPPITNIIHKHCDILKLKPNLTDKFADPLMLIILRSKNIKT